MFTQLMFKQMYICSINMKKIVLYTGILAAAVAMASCGGGATEAGAADSAAKAGEGAVNYKVDAAKSTLTWFGSKAVGAGQHSGTVALKEGTLHVEGGNLTAGSFVIDMKSLATTDQLDAESKGMLEGHLKADDFFNVEKFPTAKFEISKVEAKASGEFSHEITGNLTIRDSVRSVTFPAKVDINEAGLVAKGSVIINRLDWGINYDKEKMSLSEAAQQTAKNGIVSKEIKLEMNIVAVQ